MEIERHDVEILGQGNRKYRLEGVACLGCFAVHRVVYWSPFKDRTDLDDELWTISHLPTGHSLVNVVGLLTSEEDGIQIARELSASALCDWTSHNVEAFTAEAGRKAREIVRIVLGDRYSPARGFDKDRELVPRTMNEHAARSCAPPKGMQH